MAPPRKRRRLSLLDHSPSEISRFESESSPSHEHSVSDLTYIRELSAIGAVSPRVEELHLKVQRQVGANRRDVLQPRSVGIGITSVIESAINLGASSTPPTSAPSTSATGRITASSSSQRSFASSSPFPSISIGSLSGNGTIHTTHPTTLPITYTATLTNHNVKTITRSPQPYVTTFGDGQVSTICNRYGDCRISTSSVKSTQTPFLIPTSSTATPTTPVVVAPSAVTPTTVAPASSSTSAAAHHHQTTSAAPPPATIAGGAVGGIAGVAFLVVLVAIFIRLYKRRAHNSHRALFGAGNDLPPNNRSGMIELSSGMSSLVNVLPPLFRHQNKSQEQPPLSTEERGFTKVSGRKLPSVWSEGMTQQDMAHTVPPSMPLAHNYSTPSLIDRNSAGSHHHDHQNPFDRGTGSVSPEPSPFADPGTSPVAMTLSPGPQRTPTFVHESNSYFTPASQRRSIPLHQDMVLPPQKRYRSHRARSPSPPRQTQQSGLSESPHEDA